MPVHVTRKRGDVWYAGGAVKVGTQTVEIDEYSTGCRSRADAEAHAAGRDAEIRQAILEGPAGRLRRLTIADCILLYLGRPGGVQSWDQDRLDDFNERIGDRRVVDAAEAWTAWLEQRAGGMKPSSVARWRSVLQAALSHGAQSYGAIAPRLPGVRGAHEETRIALLTPPERKALLAAYNPWAACPVLLLAYQGLRTQEALQLDWRNVNLSRRTLFIPASETKTKRGRTAPMHARVDALLDGMWQAAGKPHTGPVFLSRRGEPYADTRGRDGGRQGGNPLAQAHETACAIAGVRDFRVHDWRHDWAARAVMGGVDLYTLMRLGGWSSLRMVQRYAAVSIDHMADAIAKVA